MKYSGKAKYFILNIVHGLGGNSGQLNHPCFVIDFILFANALSEYVWLGGLVLEGNEQGFSAEVTMGHQVNELFCVRFGALNGVGSGSGGFIFVGDSLGNELESWVLLFLFFNSLFNHVM